MIYFNYIIFPETKLDRALIKQSKETNCKKNRNFLKKQECGKLH